MEAAVKSEPESKPNEDGDESKTSGLLASNSSATDFIEDLSESDIEHRSIDERLRSASLTGSIHEMEENVRKMSIVSNENTEEDEFHDAFSSKEASPMASAEQDLTLSPQWRYGKKHYFILSEAGKPIYSRYGDEDQLAALMAVMQATVSFVQDMGDNIRSIKSSDSTIVFLNRKPLILVAVSHMMESVTQLIVQLTYLYHQVLSVLTLNQLSRIFEQRKGYDLRRMIAGSERLLDSLAQAMDEDPGSYMLSAVRVLPMNSTLRDSVSSVIKQHCSKAQNVVFALLIANNQLITLVRMKKYFIHPADLHLIFNLVNSSESFKLSESWTPICLPKFDSSGFMHAHVSYLVEGSPVCLFMLTVERDIFFALSEARRKIVLALEKAGSIKKMEDSLQDQERLKSSVIGIPEIRHYMYKSKTTAQFLSSHDSTYDDVEAMNRLKNIHFILKTRLHSLTRPYKLLYYSGSLENVIAWSSKDFEVYATFDPLKEKTEAFAAVNKLLKWIKKEESNLFVLSSPTF